MGQRPRGPFSYWGALGGGEERRRPLPLFLEPGDYTITGQGGPQIGPFQARVTVPPAFEWTNRAQIATVQRGQDLTLTWTGGHPDEFALIAVSNADLTTGAFEICACVAPAAAGRFVVPARSMANLLAPQAGGAEPLSAVTLVRVPAQVKASGPVFAGYALLDSRFVSFR